MSVSARQRQRWHFNDCLIITQQSDFHYYEKMRRKDPELWAFYTFPNGMVFPRTGHRPLTCSVP